jgi:HAE1 family hydrophobic/amphiphilic exporter-1
MSTIILEEKENATKSLEQIKEDIRIDLPKLAIADPSFERNRTSGSGEGINVQIEGKSSSQLASLADEVEWVLSNVEGLIDVRSEADLGEEEVHVVVDRDRAGQYGFSAQDVAATVTVALRGQRLRSFRTGEGEVDMRVKLQKEDQRSLEDLKNLPIFNQNGQSVRLATLANFSTRKGPQNVHRENRKTMIDISADVDGITVDEAKEKIRPVMDRYNFPPGYSWSFGRTFSYEDETGKTMMLNTILALLLIYLVMAALFESLIYPAAIWSSIIYAIVGVWWFFLITGTTFSLMAWIGILILMGVVVNNGIVLIDHVNQLRAEGMPRNDAILQGGKDRLRPILMTAGTTVLGLTPLCFGTTLIGGGGPPYFPMARAIVGGLAFSTMVTLIVLPSIYIMLDDLRNWSRKILAKSKI